MHTIAKTIGFIIDYIIITSLHPESQLEKKIQLLLWWNYDETYDIIAMKLFQNV